MIKHYLKYTIRILLKNKVSTFINVVGIILGLLVSILLLFMVKSEFETDRFLKNSNRIYKYESNHGEHMSVPKINVVKNNVPQVEHITYFHNSWSRSDFLSYQNKRYQLSDVICADSAFFNVFDFTPVVGDLKKSLRTAHSLVITQSDARKIFGKENPIGLQVDLYSSEFDRAVFTITAVIEDLPPNSSIDFRYVISMGSRMAVKWYHDNANHWGTNNYLSFALLNKNADPNQLTKRIDELIIENGPHWIKSTTPTKLLPLEGLYLEKNPFQKSMILILGSIGVLILLIACINYFNLSATQLTGNMKNEGIIQTLGDSKHSIIFRFLIQTTLMFVLAIAIVLMLLQPVLPYFNSLSNSSFQYSDLFQGSNALMMVVILVVSIIIFSVFPPLIISRIKTLKLINKDSSNSKTIFNFNNGLLVFQFLISITLIIATFFMYKQNQYMLKADYGFSSEKIMAIHMNMESWENEVAINQKFRSLNQIDKIAYSSALLTDLHGDWGRTMFYKDSSFHVDFVNLFTDENFFDLFNIPIIQGRAFIENPSTRMDMVVNEKFLEHFGMKDIDNASLTRNRSEGVIRGVCQDFNFKTLHMNIQPFAILQDKRQCSEMLVRFNSSNTASINTMLANMEEIWEKHVPSYPFEYIFYDQQLQHVYQGEIRLFKTLMIASIISLLVAGLGLFGVSLYLINNRIKEIGIRKVNGARISEILSLLNKDFIKWVIIAFIIACPLAWFAMTKWLENFAYKTTLSWWIFVLAGFIALGIALLTISWQSWRAARRNPVEALKYE